MSEETGPAKASSVRQMQVGPMANFVYLIGCERTKEAAIVDPAWDARAIAAAAERAGYKITKIFATHSHFDHVNAAAELQQLTGASLYANENELPLLQRAASGWKGTKDNEVVMVGEVPVTCLHTPGHTPGSQCLLVEGRVITGDTLFVGNIGRCDLPGSSPEALYHSLMRLKALPPETIVLPGHHYGDKPSSTIAEQAERNMYLRIPSAEAFLHLMGL
ncbi:MAG TPA: MBL fold metallo-hydrolase [Dehalococcoidia bacterium]|nr:MBL fold metallo-hydrolase [Dehalococcoidia bacterium]